MWRIDLGSGPHALIAVAFALALVGPSSAGPFAHIILLKTVTLTSLGHTAPAGGFYPDKAKDAEASGTAILACRGAANTRLDDCQVLGESPVEQGFGPAAIAVTKTLNERNPTLSPAAIGQMAILPVRFVIKGVAPATITMPAEAWEKFPNIREITRAYPRHAKGINQPGFAMLRCDVLVDGRLNNCAAAFEMPAGEGFGDAALSLASTFKLKGDQAATAAGQKIDAFLSFQLE